MVDMLRPRQLLMCLSNHTQSTAYLVGHKAADKLIAEYSL
jgi:hypothetical protein